MTPTEQHTISITSPIAVGFSVMGMFAASLVPIWGQAAMFCFGAFAFIGGGIRAAWYLRRSWGKRMIGSVLMLVVSIIMLGGGACLGWLSIQGVKGAFRPSRPVSGSSVALTPQTITGAFVEAFDIIRERNATQLVSSIDLIPIPVAHPVKKRAVTRTKTTKVPDLSIPETTKHQADAEPLIQTPPLPSAVIATVALPSVKAPVQASGPRRLSDEQKKLLQASLTILVNSAVQSATVYYVNFDIETQQFAVDLEGVLSRAGLHPQIDTKEPDKGQIGTFVERFSNSPPGVAEQVTQALRSAGVDAKLLDRASASPRASAISIFVSHRD